MANDSGIGSLGPVVFKVDGDIVRTFDGFSRTSRAVYADHEVAGGKQASEFTGMDLDEASFTMPLSASLGVVPDDEVENLRAMQAAGCAYSLMLGGIPKGYWTIRQIGEAITHTLGGRAIETRVEITLKEYNETIAGPGADAANRDAANREITGKGGPKKVPGAKAPLRECSFPPKG